jgi:hypothetical protein
MPISPSELFHLRRRAAAGEAPTVKARESAADTTDKTDTTNPADPTTVTAATTVTTPTPAKGRG